MDESIQSAPSEENGNLSVEIEPIVVVEEPVVSPVEEPTQPVVPEEPKAELYELPDGRKVDAETLSKEWKENFYPEFTRKSQELAQVKQTTEKSVISEEEEWIPSSYKEIRELAALDALKLIEERDKQRIEQQQKIEMEVSTQLQTLKAADPSLNENALFQHAMKYKFTDLQLAHQNMRDMNILAKNVQETTAKNIAKRADPVSMTPGAGAGKPDPRNFSNATDYLRSITGQN